MYYNDEIAVTSHSLEQSFEDLTKKFSDGLINNDLNDGFQPYTIRVRAQTTSELLNEYVNELIELYENGHVVHRPIARIDSKDERIELSVFGRIQMVSTVENLKPTTMLLSRSTGEYVMRIRFH